MAKRRRSAKQKANDKRLGMMARARGRKSTPKRKRRTVRNTIKQVRRRTSMARRMTRRTSRKRGIASRIPLINNPTFRKAATGVGIATLGVAALSLIAPGLAANPIVRPALALLGGDIPGLAAQVLTQGGIGNLGNVLNIGNGSAQTSFQAGFA